MHRFRVAVATLAAMLVATVVSAQTSAVSGRVANPEGGRVANAEATLRPLPAAGAPAMPAMPNMPGMNDRTAPVGADGTFPFDQVAAGQFVLHVDAPGFSVRRRRSLSPVQPLPMSLVPLEVPGAPAAAAAAGAAPDTQALLERIEVLEQRLIEFESTTVLSEPETRVRRIEVWVDENGNQFDAPTAGRDAGSDLPARAGLSPADDQREDRGGARRGRTAKRRDRRERGHRAADDEPERGETDGGERPRLPARVGRPVFHGGLAQNTIFFADMVG